MEFISIYINKIIAGQNLSLSCYCLFVPFIIIEVNFFFYSSTGENSSFPTEQSGHSKSSGRSSKAVPAGIPASGTPTAGSYSQPQTSHTYFFIISLLFNVYCLMLFYSIGSNVARRSFILIAPLCLHTTSPFLKSIKVGTD